MHVVVLAGGSGSRLWPLSRKSCPKQFLSFGNPHSLLQKTLLRFVEAPLVKSLSVVCSKEHAAIVQHQIQALGVNQTIQILTEPAAKNTTFAMAFSLLILKKKGICEEEDPILFLPSDHLLEPETFFLEALEKALTPVSEGHLVLFGIRPTKPETGYGYIRVKESQEAFFAIERFVEKPDKKLAEKYLQSEKYYWNTGIFLATYQTFLSKIQRFTPEILRGIETGLYAHLSNISFDCAVLERSTDPLMYPLSIRWSDLGTWDSLHEIMDKDTQNNVKQGHVMTMDTKGCFLLGGKKLISAIGLEDLLIIDTDDALLIAKKGMTHQVARVVKELEGHDRKEVIQHTTQGYPWGSSVQLETHETYTLFKIQIFPKAVCSLLGGGTLMALQTPIPLQIEEKEQALAPFTSRLIEEKTDIVNKKETPLEALWIQNVPAAEQASKPKETASL